MRREACSNGLGHLKDHADQSEVEPPERALAEHDLGHGASKRLEVSDLLQVIRNTLLPLISNVLLYRKTVVMGEAPEESSRCGVVKLKGDGESTKLPFTMMGGAKWVPLAYFEGEVELKKNRGQSKTPHSLGGRFESGC